MNLRESRTRANRQRRAFHCETLEDRRLLDGDQPPDYAIPDRLGIGALDETALANAREPSAASAEAGAAPECVATFFATDETLLFLPADDPTRAFLAGVGQIRLQPVRAGRAVDPRTLDETWGPATLGLVSDRGIEFAAPAVIDGPYWRFDNPATRPGTYTLVCIDGRCGDPEQD